VRVSVCVGGVGRGRIAEEALHINKGNIIHNFRPSKGWQPSGLYGLCYVGASSSSL